MDLVVKLRKRYIFKIVSLYYLIFIYKFKRLENIYQQRSDWSMSLSEESRNLKVTQMRGARYLYRCLYIASVSAFDCLISHSANKFPSRCSPKTQAKTETRTKTQTQNPTKSNWVRWVECVVLFAHSWDTFSCRCDIGVF